MSAYCLVIAGQPSARIEHWTAGRPPRLAPEKGMVWLPFRREADPPFDPFIEKRGSPTRTIEGGEVIERRAVVVLTPEEQAAYRNGMIAGTDGGLIRIVEDMMVRIAEGTTLSRAAFPAAVWDKINARRVLRGLPEV